MDTSSLCALFSYIFVVFSFIILKKNEPELARPLEIKGGILFGVFVLAVTIIYFMLYIGDNISTSSVSPEFIITIIWILCGVVLLVAAKRFGETFDSEKQELLIFGERFARKGGKNEK